jgi:hypothetical protein
MKGLLKEKTEIEKLQEEFKILTEIGSKKSTSKKKNVTQDKLILEECES